MCHIVYPIVSLSASGERGLPRRVVECKGQEVAPRARFELATLRLTADEVQKLNALSGVAYKKLGAILSRLVAPKAAPKQ